MANELPRDRPAGGKGNKKPLACSCLVHQLGPVACAESHAVAVDRFTWEHLVMHSPLPQMTRLAMLALARYMGADGTGARPGLQRLMLDTGHGRTTWIGHLDRAREAGYLRAVQRGYGRGDLRRASVFEAVVPPQVLDVACTAGGALKAISTSDRSDLLAPSEPPSTSERSDLPPVDNAEHVRSVGAASPKQPASTSDPSDPITYSQHGDHINGARATAKDAARAECHNPDHQYAGTRIEGAGKSRRRVCAACWQDEQIGAA